MKKVVKWGLFIVIGIVIAGYLYYESIQPLEVEVLTINTEDIEQAVEEEATLVAIQDQSVYALFGGKVDRVLVEVGKLVKKGDLLFSIDNRELGYQISQLNAQLISLEGQEKQMYPELHPSQIRQQELAVEEAKIRYEAAIEDYERMKQLYEAGATSLEVYQNADRAVITLKNILEQQEQAIETIKERYIPVPGIQEQFSGQRESIQAQIALAEYQLRNTRVYAPFAGIVIEKLIDEGMVIPAGTKAVTIYNQELYELETHILTEDVIEMAIGMPVAITQEQKAGGVTFPGEIIRMAPVAMETLSTLGLKESRLKITIGIDKTSIPDNVQLRPGFVFDARFVTHREENRIVLPKTTIFTFQGSDAVWVVDEGKTKIQDIRLGFETADRVVIESGLRVGDLVVRNPRMDDLIEGIEVVKKE